MPTICEPCPGKTNARSPTSDARIAAAPLSVETWRKFRYTRSAVNQRRYVQRERARRAARRRGSASRARRSPPRDHHADDQRSRPARRDQGPPERRHRLGTRSPFLSDLANGAHRTWPPARAAAHLLSTPERLALRVGAYAVAMSVAAASVIRASTSGSRARWLAWSSVALYVAF